MWIYTQNGFVSVVCNHSSECLADEILIRARVKNHLTTVLGQVLNERTVASLVRDTPDHDYPFRACISRAQLREIVALQIDAINYPNFKGRCEDTLGYAQEMILMDVWSASRGFERLPASDTSAQRYR